MGMLVCKACGCAVRAVASGQRVAADASQRSGSRCGSSSSSSTRHATSTTQRPPLRPPQSPLRYRTVAPPARTAPGRYRHTAWAAVRRRRAAQAGAVARGQCSGQQAAQRGLWQRGGGGRACRLAGAGRRPTPHRMSAHTHTATRFLSLTHTHTAHNSSSVGPPAPGSAAPRQTAAPPAGTARRRRRPAQRWRGWCPARGWCGCGSWGPPGRYRRGTVPPRYRYIWATGAQAKAQASSSALGTGQHEAAQRHRPAARAHSAAVQQYGGTRSGTCGTW